MCKTAGIIWQEQSDGKKAAEKIWRKQSDHGNKAVKMIRRKQSNNRNKAVEKA